MSPRDPLSVPQVVATIERELSGAPAPTEPAPSRPPFASTRELQQAFRAEPVGGRLLVLKRLVHWFVASSFDRGSKVTESLLDELGSEVAERRRLAERVAALEARLTALESSARERR